VYDKYIQKKKLSERLALLEREVFWAQVARHEKTLQSLLEKLKAREAELERLNRGLGETKRKITETEASHKDMKLEYRKTFFSLLEKEKELAGIIAANNLFNKIKEKVGVPADLEEELEASAERIPSIKREISAVQARVIELEEKLDKKLEEYIALKSDKAIMEFRKRGLQGEIKNFQDWVREAESKLATLKSGVEDIGERVETQRTIKEIEEEIGVVKARIEALGDIPEEAEKIYDDYSAFYEELKRRMEEVKKNRERAMSEVEARKDIWKRELRKLIKEVNATFKSILSKINATGRLKLINIEDLEEAGLEIWVGFRGSEMSLLDARTQSGGERTTAVVSFLLALQRHIKSPFLAMDEYDMHMDSRNREIIFHMITSAVRESGIQYIVITPRQIAPPGDETNFIVVQNVYGVSEARRVG
jgi:chromosome segregation protein